MAKYLGKDGKKIGTIGREIYYEAFESNLVRERPLNPLSPNTKKNIITKAKFASTMKFTDYCLLDGLTKFFPDIKGAKMKRSSMLKTNKNSFLPMHKQYYKRSSLLTFGEFKLPGTNETVLRDDTFKGTVWGKEDFYHGLLVTYECDFVDAVKVNQVSALLLETYPALQEGDIVHCFGTFCGNCLANNSIENPIVIQGNCNKKFIHRQLKIDKTDERKLEDIGFTKAIYIIDIFTMNIKVILMPICNKHKIFESDLKFCPNPGSLYFWVEAKNGGVHNKGGIIQVNTIAYDMIKDNLKNNAAQNSILNSWKIIDYPIVN